MKNLLKRLWFETEGQDLTEYALVVALVSLAATASLTALANGINDAFSKAVTDMTLGS
jgi:Flp pilus assembly pilin Flp